MGDELAAIDPAPGEAHNYFALLQYHPGELLRRLVKQHGCSTTALKVASLLGEDLVHAVLSSCLPPVPVVKQHGGPLSAFGEQKPEDLRAASTSISREPNLSALPDGDKTGQSLAVSAHPRDQPSGSNIATPASRESSSSTGDSRGNKALLAALREFQALRDSAIFSKQRSNSERQGETKAYGIDLDAEELGKVMASRKARLPGISAAEESPRGLTIRLLEKIAAIAPLRAFCAAVIALFHRHGCLDKGPLPLTPFRNTASPVDNATTVDEALPASREARAASDASETETVLEEEGNPASAKAEQEVPADTELLDFAMKISREKFPVLHRWLKQQMEAIDILAHLSGSPEVLKDTIKAEDVVRIVNVAVTCFVLF